jgi:transposase
MYLPKAIEGGTKMLKVEDYAVIRTLKQRGVYIKDIAEEIGMDRKTVSRALKKGRAPERKRAKRGSKLDGYQARIEQLLSEGVWNAKVLLRELEADGYTGGYSILREYIKPKRVQRSNRATVRFETEPGEQMQSDWGTVNTRIGGKDVKVHFVVNLLGYSRRFHFWCTKREDAEHTYEGIIRSFEYFGGGVKEVLVDNQKSTVLLASNIGQPHFNARFLDLAEQYGFKPRACRPYRARTKGKDERMVGYIKHHFFVRYRCFESWAHMNQLAEQWLSEEADQRMHGTVHEIVADRYEREKQHLKELPRVRYDTSYYDTRMASWDGYINVNGNRYSVPCQLSGQRVTIRIGLDDCMRVYAAEQLVVTHQLCERQEGWVTIPEHHAPLWQETMQVEYRPLTVYAEVM